MYAGAFWAVGPHQSERHTQGTFPACHSTAFQTLPCIVFWNIWHSCRPCALQWDAALTPTVQWNTCHIRYTGGYLEMSCVLWCGLWSLELQQDKAMVMVSILYKTKKKGPWADNSTVQLLLLPNAVNILYYNIDQPGRLDSLPNLLQAIMHASNIN